MKHIFKTLLLLSATAFALSSCQDIIPQFSPEQTADLPATPIENVSYATTPGQVVIHWTHDAEATATDLLYVKATYFDPYLNKEVTRFGSAMGDSVVMLNTYAVAGTYHVTLTPVSNSGKEGTPQTIDVKSAPVETKVTIINEDIPLTADMLWTNAQEPSEGPLPNLVDGNNNTFFHTAWSYDVGADHYLKVTLPEAIQGLQIQFVTRHDGNMGGNVRRMKVFGSNDGNDWTELYEESYADAGNAELVKGKSHYLGSTAYKYLKLLPTARKNADPLQNGFWNMAELMLYKATYKIVDFEAEAKKVIDSYK